MPLSRSAAVGLRIVLALFLTSAALAQAPAEPDPGSASGDVTSPAPAPGEPPSPPAGSTPLDPAAAASGNASLDAALAAEAARAQAARTQLEQIAAARDKRHADAVAELEAARARATALDTELRLLVGRGEPADPVYDRVVPELVRARERLEEVLDRPAAGKTVPGFSPRLDLASEPAQGIGGLYREIGDLRAKILAEDQERRWERIVAESDLLDALNRIRVDAIAELSPARSLSVLGLSRDGIHQLMRELSQLNLLARVYVVTRVHDLRQARVQLDDIFTLGTLGLVLLKLFLVLAAWLLLRRPAADLAGGSRRLARTLLQSSRARRRLERAGKGLAALAPWGLFLLMLAGVRWALGDWAAVPEAGLPLQIGMFYGTYRLVIDAIYAVTTGIAGRYRLRLDDAGALTLFRSVRLAMRVAFGVPLLLRLAAELLGRGYLYHAVLRFAWVVGLLVAMRILWTWRRTIVEAYLKQTGSRRLRHWVEAGQRRWYGLLVAAVALVFVAGRAVAIMARDFALGFDETRRLLAFLFRRRVERQAARGGYAEADVDALPRAIREAFSEEPVEPGALSVDRFPGMEEFRAALESWRDERAFGSFLLTAERGGGKTSWLARASTFAGDLPVDSLVLENRPHSSAELAAFLAAGLGLDGIGDLHALGAQLLEGPRRFVSLDLTQNLLLHTVGGYDVLQEFVSLMGETRQHVFWICAMSAFAWTHLVAVRPELDVFRWRQSLPPWNEEEIRQLIRARSAACCLEVTYEDLFVDQADRIDARLRAEEADRGYTRLLWDYADGNPRAALHFWLRSLVPEGPSKARVRLFRSPSDAELARLGDPGLFLLAALVIHENLTLQEAARVTHYPEDTCRTRLERLLDLGVLLDQQGRFRVTTHWHRAAVRLLRRRNLLSTRGSHD